MPQEEEVTEEVLWEELSNSNEKAFASLVNQYTDVLYTYGKRLCKDDDLVKDCVQEVLLFIWRRHKYLKRPQNIKFYLLRAVRNKIIREMPKWNANVPLSEMHDSEIFVLEVESVSDQEEVSKRLKNAIEKLSPRQREILYLRFYEGLKQKDIAEIMDINTQSVYNLMRTTLSVLREHLPNEQVLYTALISTTFFLFE